MSDIHPAVAEAYASAPKDSILLFAAEINHPSFIKPIRVVNWMAASPEPTYFYCKHEDDAPIDPLEVVQYIGLPFEIILPESSKTAVGSFEFKMASFKGVDKILLDAILDYGIIRMNFRTYIKGSEGDGPGFYWQDIDLSDFKHEGGAVTASGLVLTWMSRTFGREYLPHNFPALVVGQ